MTPAPTKILVEISDESRAFTARHLAEHEELKTRVDELEGAIDAHRRVPNKTRPRDIDLYAVRDHPHIVAPPLLPRVTTYGLAP